MYETVTGVVPLLFLKKEEEEEKEEEIAEFSRGGVDSEQLPYSYMIVTTQVRNRSILHYSHVPIRAGKSAPQDRG